MNVEGDILIVDDEIPNLRLLTELLERQGYRVRPAEKAQAAIDSALAQPPGLILLDVRMPEMDGFEVCRRLKQDKRTKDVPIIFINSLQNAEAKVQGFEAGGVDFITKPFQELEILARVRTHTRLHRMSQHLEQLVAERTAQLEQEVVGHKEADERLRQSEERFRNLIEKAPLDIVIMTPEGRISEVNAAWMRNWGVDEEEKAKVLATYNLRTDKQFEDLGFAPLVERAFAGESVVLPPIHYIPSREFDEIGLEGVEARSRWIQCHYYPIKDKSGGVACVVAINVDITEQKNAAEELEESESRFRNLMEQSPLDIVILTPEGRISQVNVVWMRNWGFDEDEKAKVLAAYNMRTDKQFEALGITPLVERAFAGENVVLPPIHYVPSRELDEIGLEDIQAKERWIQIYMYPVKDENGAVEYVVCINGDITEQKKTEERLRRSEEFNQSVLMSLPDHIAALDADGNILTVNAAWIRFARENSAKYPDGVGPGVNYLEICRKASEDGDETAERALAGIRSVLDGSSGSFEMEYPFDSATVKRWFLMTVSPFVGAEHGAIVAHIDISERKRAEDALRVNEKQLSLIYESVAEVLFYIGVEPDDCFRFVSVNPAFLEATGLTEDQIVGKRIDEVIPENSIQLVLDNYRESIRENKIVSWEETSVYPTGEKTGIVSIAPVLDENGICTHLVSSVHDITERKKAAEEVHESEQRFRGIMEQSPLAISLLTPQGQIFDVNEAWMQLWGMNKEEVAQVMEKYNFLTDKEAEARGVMPLIKRAFTGESVILPPFKYVCKNTTKDMGLDNVNPNTVWTECHISPVKDEKQEILFVVSATVDITKRKKAEEELRKSEQDKSLILNNTSEIIAFHDLDHNIQWVNEAYLKATGSSLSEIVGRKYYHAWELDNVCTNCPVSTAIETGESCEAELTPQNQEHWPSDQRCWMVKATPVKGDDGNIIGVIEVAYDITDRVRSEMQIREMASFAEFNPAPVLRVNPNGIIMSCNPASAEVLGKTAQKGTSLSSLLPGLSDIDMKMCTYGDMLLSREVDIRDRFYLFILRGVSDLGLVYIYGSEITQRRQSEQQMNQMRSELLHASRTRTMGELTAALAHELNHPLGSILNNANAARRYLEHDNPDMDEIRDIINDIISEDRRANEVMQKVRNLMKKAEAGFVSLDVNGIIEEVIDLMQSEFIIENVLLSKELAEGLPQVAGERVPLQQVFINLFMNAVDAMKESKTRELHISTARHDGDNVVICVRDTGAGFTDEEQGRLFTPFFTTKEEGMGMGLSVTKTIIKSHGGDIWAENNQGAGACFFIMLPCYKEKAT